MTVCKFFQQGYCRYGQNCRFEHVYGSKYSYQANPAPQPTSSLPQTQGCTDEQLVNQVQTDVESALRGGQWLLSCYSPFKEKPIFPGITDMSPEEARLFIYEAKNRNNIEQAVNYMNNIFQEARQKYERLLQPNVEIIKILRTLYKGETVPSPFSNEGQNTFSVSNTAASSLFRSAAQNTQPGLTQNTNTAASIFNQGQKSIFSTQPDPSKELFSRANNSSIFGQPPANNNFQATDQAKSIFSSAVQNTNINNAANPSSVFSAANQSIFGQQPVQSTSPFGQNQNTSSFGQTQNSSPFGQVQNPSPFGQAQNPAPFGQAQNSSPFGQPQNSSPFGQPQNVSPFGQGNVFQKTENPASIFGQAVNSQNNVTNESYYSKMEDLDEPDMEAFKSDRFELGFVPEVPPPYQLCASGS